MEHGFHEYGGVFLSKQHIASPEAGFILAGVIVWLAASLLLLPLSAALVYKSELGEASLGYVVSAVSFLSAAIGGIAASKKRGKAAVYTGLIVGCTMTCFALMLGFLIAGSRITADGVLSLVSFTLTGCIVGCILPTGKTKGGKKKNVRTFT